MKTPILVTCILAFAIAIVSARPVSDGRGWFPAGSNPKDYKMEITTSVHHSGTKAAMIQYTAATEPSGFGTFMQMHKPGEWAGKKLKMTAYVKTENIIDWCGMWCRVDAAGGKGSFDFDNMGDRPIKGTTDWKKYEIIVNVPKDAEAVAYGVLVSGKGTAYFDDVTFEVLGPADAEPYNNASKSKMSDKPENLNFEN